MNIAIKNALGIALILFMATLAFIFATYTQSYGNAQPSQRTFSVSAEGTIQAIPDIAQISLSVLTEGGKNLAELQKENTTKMNGITDFLSSQKIDAKDIQTRDYSINPRYQYFNCSTPKSDDNPSPCPPPEITGYSISQTLVVKIRNLDTMGTIISSAVEKGANNVSGPEFTIDDPTTLEQEALDQAIAKAKDKAKKLSKSAGYGMGRLISLSEESQSTPPYPMASFGMGGDAMEMKAAQTPSFQAGSQEIKATVTLTYEIK